MDPTALRYFSAAARAGSFSEAARRLGLTQPGLTRAVGRLEAELGCQLFRRLPRGVALTPEGEALLEHAGLIEAQLRDAAADLEARAAGQAGLLRIGAGPSWLTQMLPVAIAELSAEAPGLRFRVTGSFNSSLIDAVAQGELDVVVAALPDRLPTGLAVWPLTNDELQVVARHDHPLRAASAPAAPEALLRYPWALPEAHVLSRIRLGALFRVAGLEPPVPAIETDSLALIAALLRSSDMLSFATSRLLANDLAGLGPVPCAAIRLQRAAGIIMRRANVANPAVRKFVAAVSARAETLGPN